jgi:preprotein translocase subunit SecD
MNRVSRALLLIAFLVGTGGVAARPMAGPIQPGAGAAADPTHRPPIERAASGQDRRSAASGEAGARRSFDAGSAAQAEAAQFTNRGANATSLDFHLLHPTIEANEATIAPAGYKLFRGAPGETPWFLLKAAPDIPGTHLVDAQQTLQDGRPVIAFRLDPAGAQLFCKVTRENLRRPFAIVIDGEVVSAPVIQSEICSGSGLISGGFTATAADELARRLRAGIVTPRR